MILAFTTTIQAIRYEFKYLSNSRNNNITPLPYCKGHFSASDRYKYLKEAAFELAVVLDQIKGNEKDF